MWMTAIMAEEVPVPATVCTHGRISVARGQRDVPGFCRRQCGKRDAECTTPAKATGCVAGSVVCTCEGAVEVPCEPSDDALPFGHEAISPCGIHPLALCIELESLFSSS